MQMEIITLRRTIFLHISALAVGKSIFRYLPHFLIVRWNPPENGFDMGTKEWR